MCIDSQPELGFLLACFIKVFAVRTEHLSILCCQPWVPIFWLLIELEYLCVIACMCFIVYTSTIHIVRRNVEEWRKPYLHSLRCALQRLHHLAFIDLQQLLCNYVTRTAWVSTTTRRKWMKILFTLINSELLTKDFLAGCLWQVYMEIFCTCHFLEFSWNWQEDRQHFDPWIKTFELLWTVYEQVTLKAIVSAVPENIHTPTTEGIGISLGGGGL